MFKILFSVLIDLFVFFVTIPILIIYFSLLGLSSIWYGIALVSVKIIKGDQVAQFLSFKDMFFMAYEESLDFHKNPKIVIPLLIIVEGITEIKSFQERVLKDIIRHENAHGDLLFQRLQQYISPWMGYFYFQWDRKFNIENHVKEIQIEVTENTLLDFVKSHTHRPFHPQASMWEVLLVPNYNRDKKSLILLRLHHTFGDGYSIARFFQRLDNDEVNESGFNLPTDSRNNVTTTNVQNVKSFQEVIRQFYGNTLGLPRQFLLEQLTRRAGHLKPHGGPQEMYLALKDRIKLSSIKNLKISSGLTFTTAVMISVSSALSHILTESILLKPDVNYITAMLTLGAQKMTKSSIGNSFILGDVHLPVRKMSLDERILICQNELLKTKSSKSPHVLEFLGQLGSILPYVILKKLLIPPTPEVHGIAISNTPGPKRAIFVCGQSIVNFICFLNSYENPWLVLSIVSYNEMVNIGICGSQTVFENQQALDSFITNFMRELQNLISGSET